MLPSVTVSPASTSPPSEKAIGADSTRRVSSSTTASTSLDASLAPAMATPGAAAPLGRPSDDNQTAPLAVRSASSAKQNHAATRAIAE